MLLGFCWLSQLVYIFQLFALLAFQPLAGGEVGGHGVCLACVPEWCWLFVVWIVRYGMCLIDFLSRTQLASFLLFSLIGSGEGCA